VTLVERFVAPSEVDVAMEFFHRYWGANHILGNDREFMLWQMSPDRSPIFARAGLAALTYWDDDRLVGLIGVQSMPFNCDGEVADSAWLCNLQAAPEYLALGIGMKLMAGVHRLPIAGIGAAGINLAVYPMYRAMRYFCSEKLPRFIRIVDAGAARALLAGENTDRALTVPPPTGKAAGSVSVTASEAVPPDWNAFWEDYTRRGYFGTDRDAGFIAWRYLDHPRLDYRLTLARDGSGRLLGASVHRLEKVRDREERLLRVVEIIATEPAVWDALLANAERIGLDQGVAFVDHYTSRPHEEALRTRRWYEEDDHPGLVTPGLFQPLLQQTRKINLAVRLLGDTPWKSRQWRENLHVVKSDGDQDRPS
jgi:GNAT superfamily N-acetyltransferase